MPGCLYQQLEWVHDLRADISSTSSWGDWDPSTATGQTECLSLVSGGVHIAHVHIYLYRCISVYRYSYHRPSSCSAGEWNRMRPLVLVVCAVSLRVDLGGQLCIHVRVKYVFVYWEYLLSLDTGWTWGKDLQQPCSLGLLDSSPLILRAFKWQLSIH